MWVVELGLGQPSLTLGITVGARSKSGDNCQLVLDWITRVAAEHAYVEGVAAWHGGATIRAGHRIIAGQECRVHEGLPLNRGIEPLGDQVVSERDAGCSGESIQLVESSKSLGGVVAVSCQRWEARREGVECHLQTHNGTGPCPGGRGLHGVVSSAW